MDDWRLPVAPYAVKRRVNPLEILTTFLTMALRSFFSSGKKPLRCRHKLSFLTDMPSASLSLSLAVSLMVARRIGFFRVM